MLLSPSVSNANATPLNSLALKLPLTWLLLVAFIPTALLSVSCAPRKKLTQTTSVEIHKVNDSASLIRVHLSELIAIETLRVQFPDTTHTATRTIYMKQTLRDTLLTTSISLRSDTSAGVSQTTQIGPLTAPSIKGGYRGFAPGKICAMLIFLIFLALCLWIVKKN